MSLFELFWYLAGVWNMAIATVGWDALTFHDKVTSSVGSRIAVFMFGAGYALVAIACDTYWWVIAVGAILKFRLAFQHFKETKRLGRDVNPNLTKVMVGDCIWAVGFLGWLAFFSAYGICRL
jgi:hypothetical protein